MRNGDIVIGMVSDEKIIFFREFGFMQNLTIKSNSFSNEIICY